MIRSALYGLIQGELSRRAFMARLGAAGVSAAAAGQLADAAEPVRGEDGLIRLSGATGGKITCETLRSWDVTHVFGNTGAYEAGFVDALVDYPGIQYVLGLHEGPVMAMADGYARVTGKTAFVNIHSITGTANALGLIVNAWADNSPVVVSVGFSSTSGDTLGVFTETVGVEEVAELYTKLAFRASEPANLAESLRRAFRLASASPQGPVFIGVPADVWAGEVADTTIIPQDRSAPPRRLTPSADETGAIASRLAQASNPLLIAGAELPRWGGLEALASISERLGAPVSGDSASSRSAMGFPSDHPRYLGALRERLAPQTPYDLVLLAGASRLSLARGGHPLIPLEAEIIEIGVREEHLARNYPTDLTVYADAGLTLEAVDASLARQDIDARSVGRRDQDARRLARSRRDRLDAQLRDVWDETPIAPERLAAELDRALPRDTLVVTEGVSSDRYIWDYVSFDQPGGGRQHLISSGGSLGWGVGAGVGAKLGAPDKPVAVLLGDGSFQFGMQALWTAKRMHAPVIVVIFNNQAYQANRWAIAGLDGRGRATGRYIGINLDDPAIDHVAMAAGYGHAGERVERPDDIGPALTRAVEAQQAGESYILDIRIARRGPGAQSVWHE